jgi:hypothetical protein
MSKIPKILEDLYLKNLSFFEKQNPSIFKVINSIKPDHSKITVSDDGKVDLQYKKKSIYNGDAIKYAEAEVAEFKKIYQSDKRTTNIRAVAPDMYGAPRFFHQHLNETVIELYKSAKTVYPNVIHQGDRHDFLILMGIGLGLHITELLETTEVQNLLIMEADYELLALSCFFTDWEEIYQIQDPSKNKSISFLLLNNQNMENEQGSLWNELVKRAPHFPYNTIYYNHGRHNKYGDIIRKTISDIKMFMSLWGFYDDEVNQLNHILHNINNEIKLIPSKQAFKWDKPVIICGSGPSLDSRIEQLKNIRDNCILLTAGTSLQVLLRNGIKPDFHIEIESDYAVFNALKSANQDNILSEITLICAIQCSPYIVSLFKESYAFIKDSLPIGDLIEDMPNKLIEPTPTCVNAALSFAFQYQAQDIFLFGTDFGFYDQDNHHSKHAIYNDDDKISEDDLKLKKSNIDNMKNNFIEKGYLGDCLTTNLYFVTKRRIDMGIKSNEIKYKFNIYNCSDGLIIEKTNHIDESEIINIEKNHSKTINNFSQLCRPTNLKTAQKLQNNLYPIISDLCILLIKNLKGMKTDTDSLSAMCWSISNYISTTFNSDNGSITYFIRGTLWHYMISGYSITYACQPDKQEQVIEIWRMRFIDFLQKLPEDLMLVLTKERDMIEGDAQLTKTIKE